MNFKQVFFLLLFFQIAELTAQVPKPEDIFGFQVGADYKLADYSQMLTFYEKLDAASERVQMIEIGKSVMGRPIKLMFISSENNLKQLNKWREISEKLARARISKEEALALSKEGKAIVWFDGGMHASEKAHAQMTSELAYRIATEETEEMINIRENVITLLVPVINPDGLAIVVDWYRRNLGTPYETSNPPVLYQKYVGHDNNRDWFMANMPETQAVTKVLYWEWYPQIVHNHHQTSPAWARIFLPPFKNPVNPKIHPGVTTAVNLVGSAMANRFAMEEKPGVISAQGYTMWWNGGMRTAPYYHNMIGILTETAHATPTPRYYDPAKMPKSIRGVKTDGTEIFYPYPWKGGESHFRDAVDYMLTASMAVLDIAAEKRQEFLYNIYKMGKDAIENTSEAFAYIIPAAQWDKGEAHHLVNILLRGGLEGHKATKAFSVGEKQYQAGSVIFYGAQAFRPYLADLMEKQTYPDEYAYPGGPPVPPYDLAGWTLPAQMGVHVDRVEKPFDAETESLSKFIPVSKGSIHGNGKSGFLFSSKMNASFQVVNLLQRMGMQVEIVAESKPPFNKGDFIVSGNKISENVAELAGITGVDFVAIDIKDKPETTPLKKIKVGLYKTWVANMDEGWTRWVLEQHAFDLDTLHDNDIKTANLSVYQAIIIPDQRPESIMTGHRPGTMPDEYCGGIGIDGVNALEKFVKSGGTLITFDQASDFAIEQFGLEVRNVTRNLPDNQFFIPGSLIRAQVDTLSELSYGMQSEISVSFNESRAFEIMLPTRMGEGGKENTKEGEKPDISTIVSYASHDLLISGWANGADRYIKDKAAMLDVKYGNGNIVLFAFRPQFRGQPRGTYKLIFNSILRAAQ